MDNYSSQNVRNDESLILEVQEILSLKLVPGIEFELVKIGGQLVLSELRLVSRYYETRGSESTVAAWSAENNLTRGIKNEDRACNLHSLFDGKCSVYICIVH